MRFLSLWRAFQSGLSLGTSWLEKPKKDSNTKKENFMQQTNCGHTLQVLGLKTSSCIAALPETRRLVVTAALDSLFTKDWFDICTVDKISEVLRISKHSEAYRLLSTLHCVHYNKMNPELREMLPLLVRETLMPVQYESSEETETALYGIKF